MDGIVGMIKLSLSSVETQEWMPCDGRTLAASELPALAALMGNRFGGDTAHTLALPLLPPQGNAHFLIKVRPGTADDAYQGFVGQMAYWVGDNLPTDWAWCDGATIVGADYPELQRLASLSNANQLPEVFGLPKVDPLMPGVNCIICLRGLDTMTASGGSSTSSDDDI